MTSPVISVIIPALNEEHVIGACLEALTRQEVPAGGFEVLLVDNGSTDKTIAIAGRFKGRLALTILQKANCCISALRNHAARAAAGKFLAFLDADCIAPAGWLVRGIELLRSGKFGVVGAHYTIPADSSWVARAWYGDMAGSKRGVVSYVPAGDLLVGREAFLAIGGFDESIQTSEDCEFCQRVAGRGLMVFGDPALSVVHLGTPQTLQSFYRKQRWHGASVHAIFLRNMFQASGLKSTLFTFYILACLNLGFASIPAALWFGSLCLATGPLLLLGGSLVLGAGAAFVRKRPTLMLPLSVLYLLYGLSRALSVLGGRPLRPQSSAPPSLAGGAGCVSLSHPGETL